MLFNRVNELLYLKYLGNEIIMEKKDELGSILFIFVYDFFLDDDIEGNS